MKIETLVKLSNTKDGTDLYRLFCEFVRGDYAEQSKGNSSDIAHLEHQVSKAFDSFAQKAFDEGVKYQRAIDAK